MRRSTASARSRARIRPARSSAHGRRSARQAIVSSPPGSSTAASRPAQPAPARRDQRRAGGRAAGERRADAALPDPQAYAVAAPGPARTRCSPSPETADASPARGPTRARSTAATSATKNTACGLPILTSPAGPNAAGPGVSAATVSARIARAEFRSSQAAARPCRRDSSIRRAARTAISPRSVSTVSGVRAGLARQPVGDAARAVAAGAGEAAVVVVDQRHRRACRPSARSVSTII